MLPKNASDPNSSCTLSTILQARYILFVTFLLFMVLSLNQARHFSYKRNPQTVISHKTGLFASTAVRTTNQQEQYCLFLVGGLQPIPDNSPSSDKFRYCKWHKKLDEIKLIF
jgi:hypothetical protein